MKVRASLKKRTPECKIVTGGITSKSDCRKEYEEVIQKIYLPIQENPSSEY